MLNYQRVLAGSQQMSKVKETFCHPKGYWLIRIEFVGSHLGS